LLKITVKVQKYWYNRNLYSLGLSYYGTNEYFELITVKQISIQNMVTKGAFKNTDFIF